MIIYLVTNKINGNKYVGMTSQTLQTRKREHKCRANQGDKSKFYNAIRKYGWSNFKWEEIDNAMFYEDLQEKEKYWIKYYNSYKKGYNSTIGGDGLLGVDHKGEKNSFAILNDKQVLEIIKLLKSGKLTLKEIAKKYNVKESTIGQINSGRNWSHLYKGDAPSKAGRKRVQNQRGELIGHAVLTTDQVIEIKRLLSEQVPVVNIADQFFVPTSTIHNIKRGTAWGWLKTPYDDKIKTSPRCKLTEEQIKEIKRLLNKGLMNKDIAEHFNVSRGILQEVIILRIQI